MMSELKTLWVVTGPIDQPVAVFDSEVRRDRWLSQTRKAEREYKRVTGLGGLTNYRTYVLTLNAGES